VSPEEQAEALKRLAKEAIDVQDACNLSGVAHGFSRAMSKLCELGLDTSARNRHPVAVMWSSKIASLTGSESGEEFSRAYDACKKLAAGEKPEPVRDADVCPHCDSRHTNELEGDQHECYDCGQTYTVSIEPEEDHSKPETD
jgi:hypothetical protein